MRNLFEMEPDASGMDEEVDSLGDGGGELSNDSEDTTQSD